MLWQQQWVLQSPEMGPYPDTIKEHTSKLKDYI
jgi:hypothetical protein